MTQTIVRGVTVSDADILEAMQKFDRDQRNSFPEGRWKTYAVRHDGKLYPPKQIMRLATDLKDVGSGGKPINSRFEDLGFEVVYYDPGDPEIPSDDTLDTDDEVSISLESDIEAALAANIEQLEPGLHLFKENGLTGRQVQAKPAGRIDLLAKDANNRFVVIEIKAVEADRDVCGQIQAYMGWVKEHLASNVPVRGIVVASDFTLRAKYAAKVVPDLSLRKFHISFRFSDAAG